MVRRTKGFVALLAAIVVLGQHEATAQQSTDIKAVKAAHVAFHKAFGNEDIELMSQLWLHDETVRMIAPGSSEVITGWDAVGTSFENAFTDLEIISLAMKDVQVLAGPEVAWIVEVHELQMRLPDEEQPINETFLASSVYQKVGNTWMLAHHHASPPPSPMEQ